MKSIILSMIVIGMAVTSAMARHHALKAKDAPEEANKIATLCIYEATQISGYRGRAANRTVCYYDCSGSQTAIIIDSLELCPQKSLIRRGLKGESNRGQRSR